MKYILSILILFSSLASTAQFYGTVSGSSSVSGSVGIGTSSPAAKFDVNQTGGGTGTANALRLRAGNNDAYYGNNQILFSHSGSVNYSHVIRSRHNSGAIAGNSLDFYTWKAGDVSTSPGSLHVMSLNGGNVGITTLSPAFKLDVNTFSEGDGIQLMNSTSRTWLRYLTGLANNAYNNITSDYDAGIFFGDVAGINTVNHSFVIAPHRSVAAGLKINKDGKVVLGAKTPRAFLDVAYSAQNQLLAAVFARLPEGDATGEGTYLGTRGYASQLQEYNGKSFAIEHGFYGNINSSINFFRGSTVTGGFITFNTSTNLERMRIDKDGNVAIGTTDAKGYKLAVAGKMVSEEVVIKLAANWPDYVFEKDYELMPLTEVSRFIFENGHLPEIPSANEVKESGVVVGEMNAILLKKIEELTLYLLEERKQNETNAKAIQVLTERIEQLTSNNCQTQK